MAPAIDPRVTGIGQTLDPTTDLMFYQARYYDPLVGRFISADTIVPGGGAVPQALNRYSYVYNNPVSYNDPDGHVGRPVMDGGSCYGEYYGIDARSNNNCTWQRKRAEEINAMTPHTKRAWLRWNGDPARYMVDALRQFEQNYPDTLDPDVLSSEYFLIRKHAGGGKELDIKEAIKEYQGGATYGSVGGGWEVRFDVWGNVLFGILVKRMEVEEGIATPLAWGAGKWAGGESDLGDQIAIDVGYRIGDRIGNDWSLLTPELVIEELFNSYDDFVKASEGNGPNDIRIRRAPRVGVPQ